MAEITKQQKLEWLELAEEYINENDDYFEWFLCNQFDENYYVINNLLNAIKKNSYWEQ